MANLSTLSLPPFNLGDRSGVPDVSENPMAQGSPLTVPPTAPGFHGNDAPPVPNTGDSTAQTHNNKHCLFHGGVVDHCAHSRLYGRALDYYLLERRGGPGPYYCLMESCRGVFYNLEAMLRHLKLCLQLTNGSYICPCCPGQTRECYPRRSSYRCSWSRKRLSQMFKNGIHGFIRQFSGSKTFHCEGCSCSSSESGCNSPSSSSELQSQAPTYYHGDSMLELFADVPTNVAGSPKVHSVVQSGIYEMAGNIPFFSPGDNGDMNGRTLASGRCDNIYQGSTMPTKSSSSVSPAELSAMSSYPGESPTYVSPASYVSDTVANHENPSTVPIHDQLPSNNNGPTANMYQVPSLGSALPHLDGSKDTYVYSHNSPWGISAPGFPMSGHTTSQTEKQSPPAINTNVLVPNTGGLGASIYEIEMQPQGFESSPTVSARTPSPWQLRQPSTEELKKLDCSLNPADAQYPSGSRPLINTAHPPSAQDISPSTQSATSAAESTSPPGSEMAGTGRFRCEQCGFEPTGIPKNYGAYMRKHLRTHENPKIACECGKLFSRRDNATSHAKKAHRPQTPDTPPVKRRRGS